tara:strand:+ start:1568 stop:2404 length:837 start_codon:yes stop_codon:yes gene_type:complete
MSMTETQQSAFDVIRELLDSYGLSDLKDFVSDYIVENDVIDENVLIGQIRQRPEYEERFKANIDRRKAGLNVLSEGQYIALENTYRQYLRASGLPSGFYDSNDDFYNLIVNDVSPGELAERVNQGYEAIRFADPQVVSQMQELYGVGEGELAAFFLDPERATPLLLRQARAAEIAGGAVQGGGMFTADEAERLAQEGVTQQQARAGAALMAEGEVFGLTTQERQAGEQELSRQEQIGAVFGTDPRAAQRQRQRVRRRQAQFEQGGRFAGQGAELTGLQ